MRICGDFKVTINQVSQVESYPSLFTITFGRNSIEFVTINTSKGLFQYNRLSFGVSSAQAIFQRCIENLLQGYKVVSIYKDNILVTGKSTEEHLHNLESVLNKLELAGLSESITF